VTKYYYPALSFGGPVRYTYNISKYLARKGHEVSVYATDALYPRSHVRIGYKVRIIEGAEVHFFRNIGKFSEMFISPGIISAFHRSIGKYDVVHLHEYRTFQNIAFLVSKLDTSPYVVETHGLRLPEYAIREGRAVLVGPRRIYDRAFGERLLRGCKKVIALTEFERGLLQRNGVDEGKIVVIPGGVCPEDFSDPPAPDLFRTQFAIAEGRIILYVGRISKTKGIDTLVKAFHRLTAKFTDVKLVVAGSDDGYLRILKSIVGGLHEDSRVLFTGPLTEQQKLSAYNSADVIVYPGIYESFPVVPLEAAIMGRPVVVSSDPGMDFVSKGKFGLNFDYGNEYELEQTLQRILQDDRLARRLGQTGRKCVLENYTWDIVASRLEELYRRIVSQR
jgi:glycosyltransferase involved in cell wall biosynthesis